MQKIAIGTRVKQLGIAKVNVADGVKARAVLIDLNPRMKYVAYDEDLKCKVECTQELLLQYGLKPSPTFYYLIGRLNTDMTGKVVSDDVVLEYLQLSNNLNSDFCDLVEEMPQFTSLALLGVGKSVNGRSFSYVNVKPSNYAITQGIQDKIDSFTDEQIAMMWELIDRQTSISPEEYIRRREALNAPEAPQSAPAANTAARAANLPPAPQYNQPAIAAPAAAPAPPTDLPDFGSAFAGGDDFDF